MSFWHFYAGVALTWGAYSVVCMLLWVRAIRRDASSVGPWLSVYPLFSFDNAPDRPLVAPTRKTLFWAFLVGAVPLVNVAMLGVAVLFLLFLDGPRYLLEKFFPGGYAGFVAWLNKPLAQPSL